MNWKIVKIFYEIEMKRCNSTLLSLIFSIITALTLSFIFFKPMIIESGTPLMLIKLFLMYMTLFFGITFPILFLEEVKIDYQSGIFHTFLVYPINPGEIILSKLMAYGAYVFLIIIVNITLFIIFSGLSIVWGLTWSIVLIISVFLLIYVTYLLSFTLSPLNNFSPLPELIILMFFLTVTFFSFGIPKEYISILAPFVTIPEIIIGAESSIKIIIFSIGGIFLYFILFASTYYFLNSKSRRYVQ